MLCVSAQEYSVFQGCEFVFNLHMRKTYAFGFLFTHKHSVAVVVSSLLQPEDLCTILLKEIKSRLGWQE